MSSVDVEPFLKTLSTDNVKILADLFHMNIEEVGLAAAMSAPKLPGAVAEIGVLVLPFQ